MSILDPRGWRLATRVIAAAIALLAILLVITVFTYEQSRSERRAAEIDNAVEMGHAVSGIVDGFAQDLETTMLAAAIAIGQSPVIEQETMGDYLASLAERYGMLRAIFVTNPEGRVIVSSGGAGVGTELDGRPYIEELQSGAESVWGAAVVGIQTGEVTATYGRVIPGPGGEVRGYLVAAFYPPALEPRLVEGLPSDVDVTLVDQGGVVLHSTQRPQLLFEQRDLSDAPRIQTALRGEVARIDGSTGIFDDTERFGVVVPVPTTGWALAFTRPLGPLEASLRDQFLTQAAQISIAVLVLAVILTFATRWLTKPLEELAGAASAVARGERPRIPSGSGTPEIEALATAMGAMNEAVHEREDALRRESERRALVADASRAFAEAGLDLDEELDATVRRVAEFIGDGCVILLPSPDRRYLQPAALYHPAPEIASAARELLGNDLLRIRNNAASRAIARDPVVRGETDWDNARARGSEYSAYLERLGLRALASVPLRAHGRFVGLLVAWRDRPGHDYSAEDVALLREIAGHAALGIDGAQQFRVARERATALERSLRAQSELLAMVSHDLKNPLTTIRGAAQLLRRRLRGGSVPEPEVLRETMEMIETGAERATSEIDATLDIARLQTGEGLVLARRPVDLVDLLRRRIEEYRQLSKHEFVLDTREPTLEGVWDGARLDRAFENLLSNAGKYSPEGSTITVRVGRGSGEDGEQAVITVEDHGIGIPSADIGRIFERFYRARNVPEHVPGTGLGLSGVQYIVEAHGGTVEVRSTEGAGSTFTVTLPLEVAPEQPREFAAQAGPSAGS